MARRARQETSGATILLVDDDLEYAEAMRLLLEREGHQVLVAHDGQAALVAVQQRPVDLILLDYIMPRMTGEEVVQHLRAFNGHVQVVLQTGYATEHPPRSLLKRLDIQGYHDKSEGPEKLLMWVDIGLKSAYALTMLRKSHEALTSYGDRLEELVEERTRALTGANHQLHEQALVRERIESELRLAQKLKSVGQLAAGVAHEINTPIQYVSHNLAFLHEAFGSLIRLVDVYRVQSEPVGDLAVIRVAEHEADLDYLRGNIPSACECALDGIERVSKIVRAMKAFSHPGAPVQTPTSLNAALETTLVVARSEYHHIADVEMALGPIPDVVCHAGEINQVFLNLIVNAAHAIEDVVKDSGRRGTIAIATRRDRDDTVLITISDTGGGIPAMIREHVFDPFFTTKAVGKGTGQGLALARVVTVDRHGGSIQFEDRAGGGTSFFVRLPIHGIPAARSAPAAP
jgi:signal transduction histidine kinase